MRRALRLRPEPTGQRVAPRRALAGAQFFVVVEESRFLDRKYTIFGEVVKGIGVADKIVALPRVMCQTGAPSPADKGPCDNPIDRVEMTVTIIE